MSTSTNPRSGIDSLCALRDELNVLVDNLASSEDPLPSLGDLDTPFSLPSSTVKDAIGTTRELLALLQGATAPLDKAFALHIPACLGVAVEVHVAETLREGQKEGKLALHVDEIAKSSTIDPTKLARILRLLAADHIFVEKEPDVFALNRCAVLLDTGMSVKELQGTKDFYSGSNGFAAMIAHSADDTLKGAAHYVEVLLDPKTASSTAPEEGPLARGLGAQGVSIWEHWSKPEHEYKVKRFANAMNALESLMGSGAVGGFPFHELSQDTLVVDVGSGVGAFSFVLHKTAPQLKLVLEDRPEVVEGETKKAWEEKYPDSLKSGHVQLLGHDFFTPQPVKNADIYLLRCIIHDWSDGESIKILKHLAAAAGPLSKLILVEQPYDYLSSSSGSSGSKSKRQPVMPYCMDVRMLELGGKERTEEQYRALGEKAGWRLVKMWATGEGGNEGAFRQYEFEVAEKEKENGE
ncbi:hypothetical protein JCM6882_005952 [Rhodosporidiobolus microsporus]